MSTKSVTLFIPCLVDQVMPEMGVALVSLLRHFGYTVHYTGGHTCCGQPAFNAGHREEARKVASSFIKNFSEAEKIISLSGSCTAMVRVFYPELFSESPLEAEALGVGKKLYEFSEFMMKEGLSEKVQGSFGGKVGFHNSCHSYRELGIREEPLELLHKISGCSFLETTDEPVCCGFGGVFCVKFPAISANMTRTRLEYFMSRGVDTIVANDPGCILQMRKEAEAEKLSVQVLHLAEFLAQAMKLSISLDAPTEKRMENTAA